MRNWTKSIGLAAGLLVLGGCLSRYGRTSRSRKRGWPRGSV